jgi:hypothetical protein
MVEVINDCLTWLNSAGKVFCTYAGGAFAQTALLVILLFALDLLLRKRVRAIVRYCLWLLVLVKLVLPPTLALLTGIGYWLGPPLPAPSASATPGHPVETVGFEAERQHNPEPLRRSPEMSQSQPSAPLTEPDRPVTPAASSLTPVSWQGLVLLSWLAGMLAGPACQVCERACRDERCRQRRIVPPAGTMPWANGHLAAGGLEDFGRRAQPRRLRTAAAHYPVTHLAHGETVARGTPGRPDS